MVQINLSFNKFFKDIILNDFNIKKYYNKKFPNTKYTLDSIIEGIIYVLKTGIAWRDFIHYSIKWNSLFFHFNRFVQYDIFKKTYIKLKSSYLKTNKDNLFIKEKECKRTESINRDYNATLNMMNIVEYLLKHKKRPLEFRRTKDE